MLLRWLSRDGPLKFTKVVQVNSYFCSALRPRVLTDGPSDPRLPASRAAAQLRSINLAMSPRGLSALKAIDPGAAERFLDSVIPMRGRMIHDVHGQLNSHAYDRNGQVSAFELPQYTN